MDTHKVLYLCSQKGGDYIATTKMGRPTNDPKTNQVRIRMSDNELEKLNYCSEKSGKTKTEIIKLGINKVYHELKKEE